MMQESEVGQWIDCRLSDQEDSRSVRPRQTALSRLLQDRREAAGYSRARVGELIGIKPGTIEGWELGRVTKPSSSQPPRGDPATAG